MNIWFFLWLIASLVVLYFVGWNFIILIRQRKTWKDFANRHDMRYTAPMISSSPNIEGVYSGYNINLFTGEHLSEDQRGVRKLTAVEVPLKSDMIFEGGIGSGGMRDFLKNELGYTNEIPVQHENWNADFIAVSPDKKAFETYLTPDRVKAITSFHKLKNAWIILVFRKDTVLLRLDLPDALAARKKLGIVVNKMIAVAKEMEIEESEIRALTKLVKKKKEAS